MTSPILLTGGTGTLGRRVLPLLAAEGRDVRVLTRRPDARNAPGATYLTGDLTSGDGVAAAVEGCEIIVHCAGSAQGDEAKTRRLVAAAAGAGVRHLVFVSVVGVDRIPVVSGLDRAMFGYYAAKRAAEQVVEQSGLPWTTLRATQFYDSLVLVARQLVRSPVVPALGVRFQPVDTGEVASRLAELALGEPAGLVPDLAGPGVYPMRDLVRSYLRAVGKRRLLVPVPMVGGAGRAVAAGANLADGGDVGHRTWEEFLAETIPAGRPVRSS
jgi:uncharacterized protein YbjT (DUF2867 family)